MASWSAAVAHTEARSGRAEASPAPGRGAQGRSTSQRRRVDRHRRCASRGARRAERRGLAAERAPRPARARARDATRPERGSRVTALEREGVAAHPGARAAAARPRPCRRHDVRGPPQAGHGEAPEPGQSQDPAPPRAFFSSLRRAARPGGVAPGRAGRVALAARRESSTARWSSSPRPVERSSTAQASQLAIGEQATTVYADPRQVRDARVVATAAAKTLGVDADTLYSQLVDKKRSFVYVKRKAEPAKAALLQKRGLAGLGFYPEERRFYPQGSVASHILGYAGLDNRGLAGLELQLDKTIAGKPGSERRVIDALGHVLDVVDQRPAVDGRNVRLTIDHTIQATRKRCCGRPSRSGARGAPPPSSWIRAPATSLRWRTRQASTRTRSAPPRPRSRATAPSRTCTSPARRSSW